jgi:ureidoacrylate peracid hydrolase
MNTPAFEKQLTGLLVIDPYNGFISEGGILWPLIK